VENGGSRREEMKTRHFRGVMSYSKRGILEREGERGFRFFDDRRATGKKKCRRGKFVTRKKSLPARWERTEGFDMARSFSGRKRGFLKKA